MAGSDTTWKFRHEQVRMRARMTRDLAVVWPALDFSRLDSTYPAWAFAVDQMVRRYERESLERSRDYLEAFYRDNGVQGAIPIVTPPPAPPEQVDALLHSGAVASIKKSTAAGATVRVTMSRAFATTSQQMVRLVRDAAREQTRVTALNDSRFGGWNRVGTGDTCAFCRMLISRGATYSEASVRFASHTNCNCEVQPWFSGEAKPVSEYRKSDRKLKWSDKQREADRARVRHWLELHEVG